MDFIYIGGGGREIQFDEDDDDEAFHMLNTTSFISDLSSLQQIKHELHMKYKNKIKNFSFALAFHWEAGAGYSYECFMHFSSFLQLIEK